MSVSKKTFTHEIPFEVWYLRTWSTFHMMVGCIFSVIFILGAVVLNDYSFLFYLVLSIGLIWIGYVRFSKPYLFCTPSEINVRGMFGEIAHTYLIDVNQKISTHKNRIYINGKKLKFNSWFTNRHQYEKMIRFYSNQISLVHELQD